MAYRKLGRNSSNRKALFRSILSSFFKHERIETTVTKAKEVMQTSIMVIILVAIAATFFFFVDQIFGWVVKLIFGLGV